jgi:hypothetical protein
MAGRGQLDRASFPASGFVERWEEAALFAAFPLAMTEIEPFRAFRTVILVWAPGPIVQLVH